MYVGVGCRTKDCGPPGQWFLNFNLDQDHLEDWFRNRLLVPHPEFLVQ